MNCEPYDNEMVESELPLYNFVVKQEVFNQ